MEEKKMSKRSLADLSIDSQVLFNALSKLKKGDFISYEDLDSAIGKSVQSEGYGNLQTALKMMQREHGVVFDPVIGRGLKALTDDENALSTGERALRRIRNVSRRASKRLTTIVDYEYLSNDAKVKHNAHLGILGAFMAATNKKKIKRVESAVTDSGEKIGINKTLELFK